MLSGEYSIILRSTEFPVAGQVDRLVGGGGSKDGHQTVVAGELLNREVSGGSQKGRGGGGAAQTGFETEDAVLKHLKASIVFFCEGRETLIGICELVNVPDVTKYLETIYQLGIKDALASIFELFWCHDFLKFR